MKYVPKCIINQLIFGYAFYWICIFGFVTNNGKIFLTVSEHGLYDLIEVIIHYLYFFRASKSVFGIGFHELRVKWIRWLIFVSIFSRVFLIFLHYYCYFFQKLLIQLLYCELFLFRDIFESVDFEFHFPDSELKLLNFLFQKLILLLH